MPADIHSHFGLSYANYLVLHRTILQSMPEEWQHRFVELLQELDEAIGPELSDKLPSRYNIQVLARDPEYITPYEDCSWCEGSTEYEGEPCTHCEDGEVEGESRYETPEEVGIIDDPIPHYNRGRTQLDLRTGLELVFCAHCGERHTRVQDCRTNLAHTCVRCGFESRGYRRKHDGCSITRHNSGCWTTRTVD